jgi:branched-chain amino acid aminotransferase
MHSWIFKNNGLHNIEDTKHSLSSALMYGRGVFTTIAIRQGAPFLWEKHWKRLSHDAHRLNIELSGFHDLEIMKGLQKVVGANGSYNVRARITLSDESIPSIWTDEPVKETSLLITTADFRRVPSDFNLHLSKFPINSRSPLAGVKSCNYLDNILAFENSRKQGFDEGIRLNERGEVTSACMANIFWISRGEIFTPSLGTGCLPGTTREFIIENTDVREISAGVDELKEAESIFLTSAGIGVVGASTLSGKPLQPLPDRVKNLISQKNTNPRER